MVPPLEQVANRWEELLFFLKETDYDVFPDSSGTGVATADSVDHVEADLQVKRNKKTDATLNGTRSELDEIFLRKDGTFSLTKVARPSGTAGTPPAETDLLETALGSYTNDPGNSDLYALDSSARKSLSAYWDRGFFGEFFTGITIDAWELKFEGANEAMWKFDGKIADGGRAGTDENVGSLTSDATTMTVVDASNYKVPCRGTLASEQVRVTAINYTTNVLTIDRGWAGTTNTTHASGVAFIPIAPTHSVAGAPIVGPATLTIDGVAFCIMNGVIKGVEGNKEFNDETKTDKSTGFTRKRRLVTMEFEMRLYKDQFYVLQNFIKDENKTIALVITIGDTAGQQIVITASQAKGVIEGIPSGEDEQIYPLKFELKGSAGDDELNISYR